jgi:hypothetical protein
MLTTSNLLTAFMLGGWLAVAPVVLPGDMAYAGALHQQTDKEKALQRGQRTASRNRHGGSHYANLNR